MAVVILIVMLVCIVVAIILSGWKMSKKLGATMFILYIIFVIEEVLRAQDDGKGGTIIPSCVFVTC